MSRSVRRRVTILIVAGFASVAVCMSGAPAASAAGCTKLKQNQRLGVKLRWHYVEELSRFVNYHLETQPLKDQTRVFGRMAIGGATCKRNGRWRVVKPFVVSWSSVGLNAAGEVRASGRMKGWGIGVRSGNFGDEARLNLQIMHCGKGNFFSTLKFLIGVPVPKVHALASVGLWIGGMFLPADKQTCGDVGVKVLRVFANKRGLLRVVDTDTGDCCPETQFYPNSGGWNLSKRYFIKRISVRRAK